MKSRMHPGWYCFICALGSGFFTGIGLVKTMISVFREQDLVGTSMIWIIAIILFVLGGKQAEKLYDRKSDE